MLASQSLTLVHDPADNSIDVVVQVDVINIERLSCGQMTGRLMNRYVEQLRKAGMGGK